MEIKYWKYLTLHLEIRHAPLSAAKNAHLDVIPYKRHNQSILSNISVSQ